MLELKKLSFSYGDLRVLWDIDLEVHKGEIVTVVGANGAGKSTTLKNVSCLVRPGGGSISFDGHDLAKWQSDSGAAPRWHLVPGLAMEVVPGTGTLSTRDGFGDAQLHVEWAAPSPPRGRDQDRGNSGVFLMGRYEVQVLDSYDNLTYADGQAAAVYGQYPPLVNASRKPGEWQSYDIVWHRPRFGDGGRLLKPARVTLFHNGVLVQDDVELTGPTGHHVRPPYEPHADRLPIGLQDHGHKVRYRNIWLRDLEARP
jgi:energy-coupling factor transporter ATP-binding protein EcfA2